MLTSREALRMLETRCRYFATDNLEIEEIYEARSIIEKDLKALDIIKKREIDVQDITDTTDDYDLYVAYCEGKGYAEDYICSQDEFKLLREVLVDDK